MRWLEASERGRQTPQRRDRVAARALIAGRVLRRQNDVPDADLGADDLVEGQCGDRGARRQLPRETEQVDPGPRQPLIVHDRQGQARPEQAAEQAVEGAAFNPGQPRADGEGGLHVLCGGRPRQDRHVAGFVCEAARSDHTAKDHRGGRTHLDPGSVRAGG